MPLIEIQCPNPACSGRIIEGEHVTRSAWEAWWNEPTSEIAGEWGYGSTCPNCDTQGIDPESGQLDSAEEEFGSRCNLCGVVSEADIACPHCGGPKHD